MTMHDKTILLTGASSGIGRAAAELLAREGARMLLLARRAEELESLAHTIRTGGGYAEWRAVDLTDLDAVDTAADALREAHGPIDVLINNAGRSIRRPITESFDRPHDFTRTMQLNYHAPVRLTLKLLPGMLERGHGQIINVSSQSVQMPTPRFAAYVASKSALEGFTRSLACELEGRGVDFTIVNYPLVRTPMSAATKVYARMPMMDVDEAALWMRKAVQERPARVSARSGHAWQVSTALAPGLTTRYTARFLKRMLARLQKAG
ncbi:MAG: SDR family NAD(P)-dependent oxidoreductase [Oceanococcaceae bacterium]